MYCNESIYDDYKKWLIGLISDIPSFSKCRNINEYTKLLDTLFSTTFIYKMYRDKNRYDDGLELRYIYKNECCILSDKDENDLNNNIFPCSILEVLIKIAIHCNDMMIDEIPENSVSYWFWDMINNLGLLGQTNLKYNHYLVTNVLHYFLFRKYDNYGNGSIFRCNNPRNPMNETELWYQMGWYLNEILERTY